MMTTLRLIHAAIFNIQLNYVAMAVAVMIEYMTSKTTRYSCNNSINPNIYRTDGQIL